MEIHPKKCNLNRASLPIYMIPNRMLIIDSVYVLFVNQHLPTSFSFCGNKSKSSGSPYGSSGWITSCWRPGEKKKASTGDCNKDEASLLSQTSCIWLSVYLVYIYTFRLSTENFFSGLAYRPHVSGENVTENASFHKCVLLQMDKSREKISFL